MTCEKKETHDFKRSTDRIMRNFVRLNGVFSFYRIFTMSNDNLGLFALYCIQNYNCFLFFSRFLDRFKRRFFFSVCIRFGILYDKLDFFFFTFGISKPNLTNTLRRISDLF